MSFYPVLSASISLSVLAFSKSLVYLRGNYGIPLSQTMLIMKSLLPPFSL